MSKSAKFSAISAFPCIFLITCIVEEHFFVPEMTEASHISRSVARTVVLSSIWLEQEKSGSHYFNLQVALSLTDTHEKDEVEVGSGRNHTELVILEQPNSNIIIVSI